MYLNVGSASESKPHTLEEINIGTDGVTGVLPEHKSYRQAVGFLPFPPVVSRSRLGANPLHLSQGLAISTYVRPCDGSNDGSRSVPCKRQYCCGGCQLPSLVRLPSFSLPKEPASSCTYTQLLNLHLPRHLPYCGLLRYPRHLMSMTLRPSGYHGNETNSWNYFNVLDFGRVGKW